MTISARAQELLDEFEYHVGQMEMKGSQMPEFWPGIERDYELAKLKLVNYIQQLEQKGKK